MNNEILLPNRCHNFAKSRLFRLYSRESGLTKLFPLNRSRRLRTQVITHPVHILNFLQYTVRNPLQHIIINALNGGSHSVHSIDCTDDDRIIKAARIIPDSN